MSVIVLPLELRYTERSCCRSRRTSTLFPYRHSSLPLGKPRMRKCRWRNKSSWWKLCQASTFQSPPSHNLFHWKHKIICDWHLRTSKAVIIPPKLADDDAKDPVLFPAISWGDLPRIPNSPPRKTPQKKNIRKCIKFTPPPPRYYVSPPESGV